MSSQLRRAWRRSGTGARPRRRWLRSRWWRAAALLLTLAAAVVAVAAATEALGDDGDRAAVASPVPVRLAAGACGPRTAAALARVDTAAAAHIYAGERRGYEVTMDAAHVTSWQPLLQALAAGNRAGVAAAVHTIVYMPHWHIVRLRVLRAGHVLADVGGPYVTVPVRGVLTSNGRVLGSFVMSVQDDLGFEKLVTRFIGVPIDFYTGHRLVMGTLALPSLPRSGSTVTAAGRSYRVQLMRLSAFPSGPLAAALLVPTDPALQRARCTLVRTRAWGSVARHIAARFATQLPSHYADLVDIVRSTTGGYAFVLAGRRELAGGPRPRHLPASGATRYRGRTWAVYSWSPVPGERVYELAPGG